MALCCMTAESLDSTEPARWLEFARDDLAFGETGMAAHPRPAAWSFQQAAEKALKAVLPAKGRHVPRTYDVVFLLSQLAEVIPAAMEVRDAVFVLAAITPTSRYPDDGMEIGRQDAVELAQAARLIVEWAQHQCGLARGAADKQS